MNRILVRAAGPGDVAEIVAMIRELAEYEREPQSAEATVPMITEALFGAQPACEALMGEVDGGVQGFAFFFHNFSTWKGRRGVYLEDLYVRPAARGAGLGKALFGAVAKIAVQRGCPRMEWSVLDWNTPAIEFYKRVGAVAMSEWTVHRLTGDALRRAAE